jgi:hypothetical protein
VELHNFAPNAISQAATFVGVCEGYLGIPVNWDLWVHLFRAELFTQPTTEPRTRRAERAGGMSLALRGKFKNVYIPCTVTTNNAGWERGWFYLRNAEPGLPPYTGRVFKERPDSWAYGVSTPQHRRRQELVLAALQRLAAMGLNAMGVLAFLHHRRVVPLMERPLLERPYALTRARSAVDTRTPPMPAGRTPWDLEMLPTGPLVSVVLDFVLVLCVAFVS